MSKFMTYIAVSLSTLKTLGKSYDSLNAILINGKSNFFETNISAAY